MGTHLLWLAPLLAALHYAAMVAAFPSELLQNGGRFILRSQFYKELVLVRNEDPYSYNVAMKATDENNPPWWPAYWTIQKISDTQVAIKASNGKFLQHGKKDYFYIADEVGEDRWEVWTPVKNGDGSWSFTSEFDDGWLSVWKWKSDGYVKGAEGNNGCERWRLENWEGSYMDELTANGGRYFLMNAWHNKYLIGEKYVPYTSVSTKAGPPGDEAHWIIEKISEFEVSIKAANGYYLRHSDPANLAKNIEKWEKWAPVKNIGGTWSFKSNDNPGWLSGRRHDGVVETADDITGREQWVLLPWQTRESVMVELLKNGGRHILQNQFYKHRDNRSLYLARNVDPYSKQVLIDEGSVGWTGYWTIQKISDTHVAIKASNGKFLGHDGSIALADSIGENEKWTPVKNLDGSWSFKSDKKGGWLSAHRWDDDKEVVAGDNNRPIEKWLLTNWEGSYMGELLANGGRRIFRAFDLKYLVGQDLASRDGITIKFIPPPEVPGNATHFTIKKVNNNEVTIQAANGMYLQHQSSDWIGLSKEVSESTYWAPVKNKDGRWSFKTAWKKGWLSADYKNDRFTDKIKTSNVNEGCEFWTLSTWQVQSINEALMRFNVDLLVNGGRFYLKGRHGKFLEGHDDTACGFCRSDAVSVTDGPVKETHKWTIVQQSDKQVALRATNGRYIKKGNDLGEIGVVTEEELWTPVKNDDGTWSFYTGVRKGWLSSHIERTYSYTVEKLNEDAKWWLQPW